MNNELLIKILKSNNSEVKSNNEEKQIIEEMAQVLKDYTERNHIMASHVILECYAEELYSKNYRKQREGEWQIKSESYKLIDDVDEELFVECPFCQRRFNVPYELDDEKIFKYAREHYPYCNCGAKMKGGAE